MNDKTKLALYIKQLNEVKVPSLQDESLAELLEIINNTIAECIIYVNQELE